MCVIQDFPTCVETAGKMLTLFSKLIGEGVASLSSSAGKLFMN